MGPSELGSRKRIRTQLSGLGSKRNPTSGKKVLEETRLPCAIFRLLEGQARHELRRNIAAGRRFFSSRFLPMVWF